MKKADIYYVMCGIGPEKEELEQYVKEHHLEKIYNLPDSAVMYMKFYSVRTVLFVLVQRGVIRGIDGSNDRRASCCVQQNQRKC